MDDEEIEYEIPALNLVERLPGLWEPWKDSDSSVPHVGFRVWPHEARLYHLTPLFPHLQVRRNFYLNNCKIVNVFY